MALPFDNSAKDGYAVNTADLSGDGPWTLRRQDRIAAGDKRQTTLEAVSTTPDATGFKVRPQPG